MTHTSAFLTSGLLLFSLLSASLLEMKAAAPFVLLFSPTVDDPATAVDLFLSVLGLGVLSFRSATGAAGWILPGPLLASSEELTAVFSLALPSDSKNLSLDCRVLAAVVEVRGAGVGVGVTASLVVRGALGSNRIDSNDIIHPTSGK